MVKKIFFLIIGVVIILAVAIIARELESRDKQALFEEQARSEASLTAPVTERPRVAAYEDFAVSELVSYNQATPTPVLFDGLPELEDLQEQIAEAAALGPNFAGEYTIVTLPCEELTRCQRSFIVNAETGKIVAKDIISQFGLGYTLTSSLLIVNPRQAISDVALVPEEVQQTFGSDYYLFEDGNLGFLYKQDIHDAIMSGCPEIIISARSIVTEQVADFSSRCDVPSGWVEVPRGFESIKEEGISAEDEDTI